MRRASIVFEQPYVRYVRLELLQHLQEHQTPIPEDLLVGPPRNTRQFVKIVAETPKLLQLELRDLSYLGCLKLVALTLAVGGGLSNLVEASWYISVVVTAFLVLGAALFSVQRDALVLDPIGLYYGGNLNYKYIRWQDIYRCSLKGRSWVRLNTDRDSIFVRVPRSELAWLHATLDKLIERNQKQ